MHPEHNQLLKNITLSLQSLLATHQSQPQSSQHLALAKVVELRFNLNLIGWSGLCGLCLHCFPQEPSQLSLIKVILRGSKWFDLLFRLEEESKQKYTTASLQNRNTTLSDLEFQVQINFPA